MATLVIVVMMLRLVVRVGVGMAMRVTVVVVMAVRVLMAVLAVVMMVVMIMLVPMVMVMVGLQVHVELRAGDAALLAAPGMQVVMAHRQLTQLGFETLRVDAQVNHGADKHVAADTAEEIEIEGFHGWEAEAAVATSALIWLAAYPAPKPLSILTTVTPLPQLLSMPSRGARPPKLAP